MTRYLVILLLSAFVATSSFAQANGKYRIHQYTTDNGMPSNGVKGLKWDETTGFLWVATEAGIARFNGLDFTLFNRDNTQGITHERIAYLLQNDKGIMYTADVGGNIFRIGGNSLERYNVPVLFNPLDPKDRYYFCVSNPGLQKKILSFKNKTSSAGWLKLLQPDENSCIVIDGSRNFYYTSSHLADFIPVSAPANIYTGMMIDGSCFLLNRQGKMYAANEKFSTFEEKRVSSNGVTLTININNSIIYWQNGMQNPILLSGNNAWLLQDKKTHIEALLICSGVPTLSYIQSAQYSKKNNTLFIGTDSKGIIIITENSVLAVKNKDADISERNTYYSQVELQNGNILTNAGHVVGPATSATSLPIKGSFNFTTHSSGDSLLWYVQHDRQVGYSCLHKYNYKTKETTILNKIPAIQNFALQDAKNGSVYIATDAGLGVLKQDSLEYIFVTPQNKRGNADPFQIEELSDGVFVVASCKGLVRYNINSSSVDTILNLPGNCIRSLWKYKDYLFIGTYGKGYYIYKDEKIMAMPLDKNKFLLHTHCFIPDEYGYFWMSTNRGLFKARLSDVITAYEKNVSNVYYHYFGKNDGMEITEMNGGCAPCALLMKNKLFSFPTMDGLLWVNPEKANPVLPVGEIYIDEFRAGNKVWNIETLARQSLSAKPEDIAVAISFSAWCNKENIYVEYQLNNSNEWIPVDITSKPIIRFSNLSSGKYKLTFRKMNGFGIDNYTYKEIVFKIKTPWYQEWWFYVLAILLTTGLIGLYLRFRTKQYKTRQRKLEQQVAQKTKELQNQNEILEKNNTIKTRLISIISHDIVTPLKFLTSVGNNLVDNKAIMSEELQKETIREMANTSQELQLLSTNILNWIKYQNENRRLVKEPVYVYVLTNQVLSILSSIAKSKGLQLKNDVEESLVVHQFGEALKILLYNLLTNAINFSEQGCIVVSSKTESNKVILSVKDEGAGMTPEQVDNILSAQFIVSSANVDNRKGNGLGHLIIKDLLKMMDATMSIESAKGVGSTISIIIPD